MPQANVEMHSRKLPSRRQTEIDDKKKEFNVAQSKRLQAARTRTELDEKLAEVARKLLEADDGRRTTEKEARMRELLPCSNEPIRA